MNRGLRNILIGIVGFVVIGVAIAASLMAFVVSSLPPSQGPRLEVREGLVGVDTGGSYAWIVQTETGAALVDTGIDGEAKAILAELSAMGLQADDVHTILLTHAHRDHTAGLPVFPRATLVHGPGEGPLVRGEDAKLGLLPALFASMMPAPPLPAEVVEASDGQLMDIDGDLVTVVATPGHTLGSTSFVWGDVLFSGDALFGGPDGVMIAPGFLNSDQDLARRSVERFGPLDPVWMADGHAGITPQAGARIHELLAR